MIIFLDQPVPRLVQELAEEQKRLVEFGKWEVGIIYFLESRIIILFLI